MTVRDIFLNHEVMKTITVSVDDETYRRACVRAAERGSSLAALIRQFLDELAREDGDRVQLKREEAALRASIRSFRASDRISRDEIRERDT